MTTIELPGGSLVGGPALALSRLLFAGGRVVDPAPRTPAKVPANRRVRVLAVVHGWFPALAAGSERMMQHLLDALPTDEYHIEILSFGVGETDSTTESEYLYEGYWVHRGFRPPFVPDLIITHHGMAARVVSGFSEVFPEAPVVLVHHNERYDLPDLRALRADLNVYNTRWVRVAVGGPGIVVHPPVEPERHRVPETGEAVTLVNLQENKGVDLFYELAGRMAEFPFLGVTGSHGQQKPPPERRGQLQVHPLTQDMREVWAQTKVVLMPSAYESYGMVAAEACLNGIPVIAHPTPGLLECLGDAGIFIDREDTDSYERTLRLLLTDDQHYRERSETARLRGDELIAQTTRELRKFTRAVRKLVRE